MRGEAKRIRIRKGMVREGEEASSHIKNPFVSLVSVSSSVIVVIMDGHHRPSSSSSTFYIIPPILFIHFTFYIIILVSFPPFLPIIPLLNNSFRVMNGIRRQPTISIWFAFSLSFPLFDAVLSVFHHSVCICLKYTSQQES